MKHKTIKQNIYLYLFIIQIEAINNYLKEK